MACIRKRRGRYVVDYRDGSGIRRWATFRTREEATAVLGEKIREARQHTAPLVDPTITLRNYAERWFRLIAATVKPRTFESYSTVYRLHLDPTLGPVRVRNLTRGRVRDLLVAKLQTGKAGRRPGQPAQGPMARKTVGLILATLRGLLSAAIEDNLIATNPADRHGRALKLLESPQAQAEAVKALDRGQLAAFLEAVRTAATVYDRKHWVFFLTLARTGLRLSEALALQWDDLDFAGRSVHVQRALSRRQLGTPKSGHGRTVDMSAELAAALQRLRHAQQTATLARGRPAPAWVFLTDVGTPLDESRVRKVMRRALRAAGLPPHFTPHCLRHSFASLLLQQGESAQYVQEQLGHASIELTTRTYGRWLPKQAIRGGVDALDTTMPQRGGSKTVAAGGAGGDFLHRHAQMPEPDLLATG